MRIDLREGWPLPEGERTVGVIEVELARQVEWPLRPSEVAELAGISKSKLFDLEREGVLVPSRRIGAREQGDRRYYPCDIYKLFKYMQPLVRSDGVTSIFPWLQGFDLDNPSPEHPIITPSGWQLHFGQVDEFALPKRW